MKKLLANLIGKKFSVYVGGEFERMTDFLGFIKLLADYSDFMQFDKHEQIFWLKAVVRDMYAPVDADIYVKIGR